MIWAYLSFSQFLLIWAGNLPDETTYYVPRFDGRLGLGRPGLVLLASSRLPFLLLLSEARQGHPRPAGGRSPRISLFMHFIDLMWLTYRPLADNGWDLIVAGAGRAGRPGRRLAEPVPVAAAAAAVRHGGRDAPGGRRPMSEHPESHNGVVHPSVKYEPTDLSLRAVLTFSSAWPSRWSWWSPACS